MVHHGRLILIHSNKLLKFYYRKVSIRFLHSIIPLEIPVTTTFLLNSGGMILSFFFFPMHLSLSRFQLINQYLWLFLPILYLQDKNSGNRRKLSSPRRRNLEEFTPNLSFGLFSWLRYWFVRSSLSFFLSCRFFAIHHNVLEFVILSTFILWILSCNKGHESSSSPASTNRFFLFNLFLAVKISFSALLSFSLLRFAGLQDFLYDKQ